MTIVTVTGTNLDTKGSGGTGNGELSTAAFRDVM
jgi:hypothetical protein